MKAPLHCNSCGARLPSVGAKCPACGVFSPTPEEHAWREQVKSFRRIATISLGTTAVPALLSALSDPNMLFVMIMSTGICVWVRIYYSNRLNGKEASLPGQISPSLDEPPETGFKYDLAGLFYLGLANLLSIGFGIWSLSK
jgi:hypothetical protein